MPAKGLDAAERLAKVVCEEARERSRAGVEPQTGTLIVAAIRHAVRDVLNSRQQASASVIKDVYGIKEGE